MLKFNIEKIVLARAQATMTVRELSKISSVSASTINKIEKGKSKPNAVTIGKIAKALKIPISDLLQINRR